MLLKPRKRIEPGLAAKRRQAPEPAFCAYCRGKLASPPRLHGPTDLLGSTCGRCGAICVADPTGKQGGEALMAALRMLADGDDDRAMSLREGVDYESRVVAWSEASNEVDPSLDANRYGVGRLWFFRVRGPVTS